MTGQASGARVFPAWPYGLMLASMLSTHIGAALAKTLFPRVGPFGMSGLRLGFAALVLLALMRPSLKLPRSTWRTVVIYGIALGCMNTLFYCALQRVHLGVAVTLEFSGPLVLAAISSRRALDFVWILLALAGMVLLFPRGEIAAVDPLGALLAVAAGACWALYIFFGRRAGIANGASMSALGTAVASIPTLILGLCTTPVATLFSPTILPLAFAVAMLSAAIPYSFEMKAMAHLPTRTAGVIMSLQPAFGALMGLVLLKEQLSHGQWAAVAVVMAASIGAAATASRTAAPVVVAEI